MKTPVRFSAAFSLLAPMVLTVVVAGCNSSSSTPLADNASSSVDGEGEAPVRVKPPLPPVVLDPNDREEQGEPGICDPLNEVQDPDSVTTTTGLYARLYYVPNGSQDNIKVVEDVFTLGKEVDTHVFFNQVNVPTRLFSTGFGAPGRELKDDQGNMLTAWFGMKMETILKLPPNMTPGYYQFALVSDDGAVLRIRENNVVSTLVDNNGTHSTASACGSRALYVDGTSNQNLLLDYHQGPPNRIAVTMMWRKVAGPVADTSDAICHTEQDQGFFAPEMTSPYNKMVAQGFSIVPSLAFELPPGAPERICQ